MIVVVRFRCNMEHCKASGHDHEKFMRDELRGLFLTMDVVGVHAEPEAIA